MKKAFFVLALVVAPFLSLADDITYGLATTPKETGIIPHFNSCSTSSSHYYLVCDAFGETNTQVGDFLQVCLADVDSHLGAYTGSDDDSKVFVDTVSVSDEREADGTGGIIYTMVCGFDNDDGSVSKWSHSFYLDHEFGDICPDSTTEINTYCYDTQELIDNDTCDVNSDWLVSTSTSTEYACYTKEDNSRCLYVQSTANGQTYYSPNAEPDNCYSGDYGEFIEDSIVPPTDNCSDIGNGVFACSEDPLNVCSNGVCQEGCGNVSFDGQSEFVCLSGDTDGDGIGDYADPDIDGDGVKNEDDLDYDGDGLEDPVYDTGSSVSLTTIESLLSDIKANTSGDSSSGSGASAEDIADELQDVLVESGNFDTDTYETKVDDSSIELDSQIDTLLTSDDVDLNSAFTDSGIDSELDSLTSLFAPGECNSSISIPFTSDSLDFCEPAQLAQPYLYVIFAIGTFIFCFRRVLTTVRGAE